MRILVSVLAAAEKGSSSALLGRASLQQDTGLISASCFLIPPPPTCLMQAQVGLFMSPGWGGDLILFLLVCSVNILVLSTLLGAGCHVEECDSFMLLLLRAQ